MELGKGGAEAELFGVAGINAGNEGADEFVEEFGGKFAAREFGDGFVYVGWSAAADGIAEDAPLGARTEKGRGEEGGWAERCWF